MNSQASPKTVQVARACPVIAHESCTLAGGAGTVMLLYLSRVLLGFLCWGFHEIPTAFLSFIFVLAPARFGRAGSQGS